MFRLTFLTLLTIGCLMTTAARGQQELPLWPEGHPANAGDGTAVSEAAPQRLVVHHGPSMLVYLPQSNATGAAVLVCPGGGYGVLAIDHEGFQVAEWLNERGIAAFVLKYRCGGGENAQPAPLDDAQRAMRIIRSRAEEWGIDGDQLGVMGFSAGGHLASSVSTLFDEGDQASDDPLARLSCRPDFSILVYPVISMERSVTHGGSRQNLLGDSPDESLVERYSTDRQVTDRTPPTFIAHASDDRGVIPENALRYYKSLLEHSVPAELHMYEHGGHGFGMNSLRTHVNDWLGDLDAWLTAHKLAASDPE